MKPPANSDRFPRALVCAIIGVFLALSAVYNAVVPPFEGVDEAAHFTMVDWYATHATLPDLNNPPAHEAFQPPLYHVIVALAIAPIDRSDFPSAYAPHPDIGNGFYMSTLPTPETTRTPPKGSVLALRIARFISGLFGAVTIALTASSAWLLFRRRDLTLFASALVAFNPKILHMSSTITNDIAVAAATGLAIWLSLRVSRGSHPPRWPILACLGAACGIAFLSKYSGLAALAPAGIALIFRAIMSRETTRSPAATLLWMCACTAAGFGAVSAWFLIHNLATYGDPLAWSQVSAIAAFATRQVALDARDIAAQAPTLIATAWGNFGYGIRLPFQLERVLVGFSAAAAAGLIVALGRRQLTVRAGLLVIAIGASFAAFVSWMAIYVATETARLMSPAAMPAGILLAAGALAWVPQRARLPAAYGAVALVVGLGAAIPWTTLIPAYRPPEPLNALAVASLPDAGRVLYANGIELVQATLEETRLAPGEPARVRLLWRATRPMDRAFVRVVEAIGPDGISIGRQADPPLDARISTRFWEVGAVYEEVVAFGLDTPAGPGLASARVYVGWHEHLPPYALVTVAGSEAVSAQVGALRVRVANRAPIKKVMPIGVFGGLVQLLDADIAFDEVKLTFGALRESDRNFTLFVHGYDASGALVTQEDSPMSPAAPLWLAEDRFGVDQRVKGLGAAARVGLGIYDTVTRERLPAYDSSGGRYADDIVPLR